MAITVEGGYTYTVITRSAKTPEDKRAALSAAIELVKPSFGLAQHPAIRTNVYKHELKHADALPGLPVVFSAITDSHTGEVVGIGTRNVRALTPHVDFNFSIAPGIGVCG